MPDTKRLYKHYQRNKYVLLTTDVQFLHLYQIISTYFMSVNVQLKCRKEGVELMLLLQC